jgi:hypothetical protein
VRRCLTQASFFKAALDGGACRSIDSREGQEFDEQA